MILNFEEFINEKAAPIQMDEMIKYGIRELKDGVTLDFVRKNFGWILKAKIKNAVIGCNGKNIRWYNGTWIKGIWKGPGVWENGKWEYGTWHDGTWKNGVWEDGTWVNGVWEDGKHFDGLWKNGMWKGGTWEDGEWLDGSWKASDKGKPYGA